ncbi:MAG: hypothetical protein ACRCZO_03225, partial [Cetobacterium sp.]
YNVPYGKNKAVVANLDALALDDLSNLINRRDWKKKWCNALDKNSYLGLDWMRNITCNTSQEIDGVNTGIRWFNDPVGFLETGVKGIKTAATAVVNFVSKDMWSWITDSIITMGWYSLYAGLTVIGIILLFIMIKCLCTATGQRLCSKTKDNADELEILEQLLEVQERQHKKRRWSKKPLM